MSDAALRQAADEVRRLADSLGPLKALTAHQAALPVDDGAAWAALQRRKQTIYDDLAAMRLPDFFLRLRQLAAPAPGDEADTAAARRDLFGAAEASIRLMSEIAAAEAAAQERLRQGLTQLKQQASALRRGSELHRAYAPAPSPRPRFLDARE